MLEMLGRILLAVTALSFFATAKPAQADFTHNNLAGGNTYLCQTAIGQGHAENPKLSTELADLAQAVSQRTAPLTPGEKVGRPKGFSVEKLPKSLRDAVHAGAMRINEKGEVQVYIEVTGETVYGGQVSQLSALGATPQRIVFLHAVVPAVQAWLPITMINQAAMIPFVRYILSTNDSSNGIAVPPHLVFVPGPAAPGATSPAPTAIGGSISGSSELKTVQDADSPKSLSVVTSSACSSRAIPSTSASSIPGQVSAMKRTLWPAALSAETVGPSILSSATILKKQRVPADKRLMSAMPAPQRPTRP
jgi:hypothetical protein